MNNVNTLKISFQSNSFKNFIFIVVIMVLGFIIYGNSINGTFIWDDDFLVKNNTHIKQWSYLPRIFNESLMAGSGIKSNFYRPIQTLTYRLNYRISGLDVRSYHLSNIILHILVAICIYWMLNILYKNKIMSFLAGILFVVHPIHTECVSYISGRADLLAGLFMLLGFIAYVKNIEFKSSKLFIAVAFCYICALLSKENSIIFPLILLIYHYVFKIRINKNIFIFTIGITSIYILLRLTVLKFDTSHPFFINLLQRIPGFFVAITNYIILLLLPFHLHMEYGYVQFRLNNPAAILGICILVLSLIYIFQERKENNIVTFSILWFFITLVPYSNLFPINAYMAEHWLYIPSIGFFLLLAKYLCAIYEKVKNKIIPVVVILSVVIFYSYLTIRQNEYWNNPITFYERLMGYVPYSPRICNNLAGAYQRIGENEKAIKLYERVLKLEPENALAYYNLGNVYSNIGMKNEAIEMYKKAIDINPSYIQAYNNLGNIYREKGKVKEAVELYKKALAIDPACKEVIYNIKMCENK